MSMPAVDLSAGRSALTVLAARGADAARFLQGQLSADIEKLAFPASTLAGFHSPQGRVIALLAIARVTATEFFIVLPRELGATVVQRLAKYVLRAKVKITDESQALRVTGAPATGLPGALAELTWGSRRLFVMPAGSLEAEAKEADEAARDAWERVDITDGLPQIYTATSEAFVAQMLNLDVLGAIAFDKGCYTGQEVIARAHYRGRVKRRLQRWHAADGAAPRAGDSARTVDGRALTVVRAAPGENGGWDLLAVGTFAGAAAPESTAPVQPDAIVVNGPLPLPYSLPE